MEKVKFSAAIYFDNSAKYQVTTKRGSIVVDLHCFYVDDEMCVYGVLNGEVEKWTKNGVYSYTGVETGLDLYMTEI